MKSSRKNIDNKKCIHCLTIPAEITDDHVIPESWYSAVKSKQVFKPKAPACLNCNQKLGKQEKIISHIMWMCMPASHPLTNELKAKVFRACGLTPDGKPLPGLEERETRIRKLYAKELVDTTKPIDNLSEENLLFGFTYHREYPKNIQKITKLDEKMLSEVASKIIRGLEYIQKKRNRYIEDPYKLEVHFPKNPHEYSLGLVRNLCPIFSDGTNTIQRGAVPNKPLEPIYIIRLWDQWEIWGVIIHKDNIY